MNGTSLLTRLGIAGAGLVLVVALVAGAAGAGIASLLGAGIASLLGGGDETPNAAATTMVPPAMLALYQQAAATCPGLPWTVLAAIGTIESNNGASNLPGVHSGANSADAMVIYGSGFPGRHVRHARDPRRASRISTSCEPRTASVLAS